LFEVGVTSLTLTEIVLAVDERYPGKLDISDLFDYPTIRELASFIRPLRLPHNSRARQLHSTLEAA
jgi:acyl carrier protein